MNVALPETRAGGAITLTRGAISGKDRIFISELEISVEIQNHGFAHRVPLLVDIDLYASATPASVTDDIELTLDYTLAANAARNTAATGRFRDLDSYGRHLGARLEDLFPQVPTAIRLWPNGPPVHDFF